MARSRNSECQYVQVYLLLCERGSWQFFILYLPRILPHNLSCDRRDLYCLLRVMLCTISPGEVKWSVVILPDCGATCILQKHRAANQNSGVASDLGNVSYQAGT